MKYFTPELYLRYNTDDDRGADDAEEAWEAAIGDYKRYLKEHRAKMPTNVRCLAEKCCFHDAALLGRQTHEQREVLKPVGHRMLTLGLQQSNEMIVLGYFLAGLPREIRSRKNWPFSPAQKHWLYDEVGFSESVGSAGALDVFVHRILWSDGSELEIPFVDLIIDEFQSLTLAEGSD